MSDTCDYQCCQYPNGIVQVMIVQSLLFVGWILSATAIADCRFVKANGDIDDGGLLPIQPSQGLGFYFFEDVYGDCFWQNTNDGTTVNNIVDLYTNSFLGSDWDIPRIMGLTACGMSLFLWLWTLWFSCTAHRRPIRYMLGFLLLIATALQGLTFLVYSSSFCDTWNCQFNRSAGYSIGAAACFFISSIISAFFMRDYPGDKPAAEAAGSITQEDNDMGDDENIMTPVEEEDSEGPPIEKVATDATDVNSSSNVSFGMNVEEEQIA